MASLTIGGQARAIELSARAISQAERQILKLGGQKLLATLSKRNEDSVFAMFELEAVVMAAWTRTMPEDRAQALLAQFYAEGGTLFELHAEVLDAIVDSGVLGRRPPPTNGTGPPADPPEAGTSA